MEARPSSRIEVDLGRLGRPRARGQLHPAYRARACRGCRQLRVHHARPLGAGFIAGSHDHTGVLTLSKRDVDNRDHGVATQNLRRGKQGEPLRLRRWLPRLGRALDLNSPLADAGNHAIVSALASDPDANPRPSQQHHDDSPTEGRKSHSDR